MKTIKKPRSEMSIDELIVDADWFPGTDRDWQRLPLAERDKLAFAATVDKQKGAPALFVTDGDGRANGRVYHFCSEECCHIFKANETVVAGDSSDYIDGTACDECGKGLV